MNSSYIYYSFFTQKAMAKHNEIGKLGENIAETYLGSLDFCVVERNWKCPKGEIDLIVTNSNLILFVEVKTRTNSFWGTPEKAVSEQKIRRIVDAADYYLKLHELDLDIRFDVISITFENNKPQLHHIKDAFLPPLN